MLRTASASRCKAVKKRSARNTMRASNFFAAVQKRSQKEVFPRTNGRISSDRTFFAG